MCVRVCVLGWGDTVDWEVGQEGGKNGTVKVFQNNRICDGNPALSRRILYQMRALKTEKYSEDHTSKEVSE